MSNKTGVRIGRKEMEMYVHGRDLCVSGNEKVETYVERDTYFKQEERIIV